jgi:hypothetical protein
VVPVGDCGGGVDLLLQGRCGSHVGTPLGASDLDSMVVAGIGRRLHRWRPMPVPASATMAPLLAAKSAENGVAEGTGLAVRPTMRDDRTAGVAGNMLSAKKIDAFSAERLAG